LAGGISIVNRKSIFWLAAIDHVKDPRYLFSRKRDHAFGAADPLQRMPGGRAGETNEQ
jgi:hypothetical protein